MALVIRPEMGNIASVDRGNRRRNKDVGRAKLSSMSGGSSRHARRMSISLLSIMFISTCRGEWAAARHGTVSSW
jgi:hypothetical protein